MLAYNGSTQQRNHLTEDVGHQRNGAQLGCQLQADGGFLELRDENGRQRVISKSASHGHAVEYAPFAEQQAGECGKKQGAGNRCQGNEQHLRAQAAQQLFQVLVAANADAHLKHECIQHVHRQMMRIHRFLKENTQQTADTENGHYNQTSFHFLSPFLKNR